MKSVVNIFRVRVTRLFAEVSIYFGIAVIISGVAYSFLRGAMTLYAKNMSIVRSHTNLRSVLDRLGNNLQQANSLPVLINTRGAVAAAPAAGLYYDRYLGDPYVVTNPGGAGLPSATMSVTITRSTVPLASPPIPVAGDAIMIDDPNDPVRALIATSTPVTVDTITQRQPISSNGQSTQLHAVLAAQPLGLSLTGLLVPQIPITITTAIGKSSASLWPATPTRRKLRSAA